MKRINIYSWLAIIAVALFAGACEEPELSGPQIDFGALGDAANPTLEMSAAMDSIVFLEDNEDELFQTFSVTPGETGGVSLPWEYTLQMDTAEAGSFAEPIDLGIFSNGQLTYTVGGMNQVLFDLGLPFGEQHDIYLRVKATAKSASGNATMAPLYSAVAMIKITTYSAIPVPNYPTVGIIGSATPGGWDADTDMTFNPENVAEWKVTIYLEGGQEAKFRANDAWDVNWGGGDFPSGTAEMNGPNIPVAESGVYDVTFNDQTGEYSFEPGRTIGIIGSATPGGWDTDTDMANPSGDGVNWELTITLIDGEAKFRENDAWDVNWGGADFPSGTAEAGGANIPVTAGTYNVTFNTETGAYNFGNPTTIGIIGSATPGGWDADTDMDNPSGDLINWELTLDLVEGEAKFRLNDAWDTNWGATDFPSGTGLPGGDNIPISQAGTYKVTFNSETGEYNFSRVTRIGIIGSATPGGWDADTDMMNPSGDDTNWELTLDLVEGEAKFRADNAWDTNWGATDFPSGTGLPGGDNIPVAEGGTYKVTFNSETGEYNFEKQ